MNIVKIKRYLKTKAFWFSVVIAISSAIGQTYPPLQFLIIPHAMTMLALIPIGVAILSSSNFAEKFVRLHKWWHRNNGSYSYATIEVKMQPVWKSALKTTAYSFAIIYNILLWTGTLDTILNNPNKLPVMVVIFMPSLFAALVIHLSIYLLTKSGLMFEDKEDGSRINLGREMTSKLDWAISPILLVSLIYSVVTKPQTMPYVLMMMLVLFMFCYYAAFIGLYILKKYRINQLSIDVKRRLNRVISIL